MGALLAIELGGCCLDICLQFRAASIVEHQDTPEHCLLEWSTLDHSRSGVSMAVHSDPVNSCHH